MNLGFDSSARESTARPPRILLVDDDPVFGRIMGKVAERERVPLTYIHAVEELDSMNSRDFDLGIFDYDLGPITGVQLSGLLDRYLGKIPVILISQYKHLERRSWPSNVKEFISKTEGAYGIIHRAKAIFSENKEG